MGKCKPWNDEKRIAYYTKDGFTRTEAKGMILTEEIEPKETLSNLKTWSFHCPSCNKGVFVHSAGTVRMLLSEHRGHHCIWTYMH